MASQADLDKTYMACAIAHQALSYGIRAKVGACLVTKNGIIIPGVNGLPKVLGNQLEYETDQGLVTKPSVIHAEQACLNKAAREGMSVIGSTLYTTLSCCQHCASNMIAAGISRVVYLERYRDTQGLELLYDASVPYEQMVL